MKILEKLFFYLLIFCLPLQLRWTIFSSGQVFNEWLSGFLYLTDLLLVGLILIWLRRIIKHKHFQKEIIVLISFLGLGLLSLFWADNFQIAAYSWLKLLEMVLFFLYLKHNFGQIIKPKTTAKIFVLSSLIQAVIAILQYVNQKSLGLGFLRESLIEPYLAGVAKFELANLVIVRAYGLLPHPNVLAAFLLIGLFCLSWLYFKRAQESYWLDFVFAGCCCLLLAGLFFTFSRVIIFSFLISFLFFLIYFFRQGHQKEVLFSFLIVFVFCFSFSVVFKDILLNRLEIKPQDQAIALRLDYNQVAWGFVKEAPLFGVGLGQFVAQEKQSRPDWPQWQYQPAHNLYLLIAAELGLIGLLLFLSFLGLLIKKAVSQKLTYAYFVLFAFLFMAFFDHFFWTLQQGQLMWWLVLGIIVGLTPKPDRV